MRNAFIDRLYAQVRLVIYETLRTQQPPTLLPYGQWKTANELGIEYPPAPIMLETWKAMPADRANTHRYGEASKTVNRRDDHVVVALHDTSVMAIFEHAAKKSGLINRLVSPAWMLAGYDEYDAVPVINTLAKRGETVVEEIRLDTDFAFDGPPDEVMMDDVEIITGGGSSRENGDSDGGRTTVGRVEPSSLRERDSTPGARRAQLATPGADGAGQQRKRRNGGWIGNGFSSITYASPAPVPEGGNRNSPARIRHHRGVVVKDGPIKRNSQSRGHRGHRAPRRRCSWASTTTGSGTRPRSCASRRSTRSPTSLTVPAQGPARTSPGW